MDEKIFEQIPEHLTKPLLEEYEKIVNNYLMHRWTSSELSGGKFCEIVFTIIKGYVIGQYPSAPEKPRNIVDACRALEQHTNLPRSLRILIPRILPALYEVRNNRGVGHTGGDVDSNFMDSNFVVSTTSWILAEMIRVFHNLSTIEAQNIVNDIVEIRHPIVWKNNGVKRILDPSISKKNQILILLASHNNQATKSELKTWTETRIDYLNKLLKALHKDRFIEFNLESGIVHLLPPGYASIQELISKFRI